MSGIPEKQAVRRGVTRRPRATEAVLIKLTPDELAGIDRVVGRMGYAKRAPTVKALLAAVVKRSDAEHGED